MFDQQQFDDAITSAGDSLTRIVRAHFAIDKMLDALLQLLLPRADRLEVHRIAFLLKIDFLIALGALGQEARPVLLALNSARNKVAHDPFYEFNESDAKDSKNTVRSTMPQLLIDGWRDEADATENLRWLLVACFVIVEQANAGALRAKAKAKVLREMVAERAIPKPDPNSPTILELEQRIAEALATRSRV